MSRGHQLFVATGRLGDDARTSAPQSGGLIATFSIAVTRVWKDRAGERHEHTEWIRCKCFSGLADVAQKYCTKGRLVSVQGRLVTEKWQGNDGSDRYSTWVYLDELDLHGGRDHEATGKAHQGRPRADRFEAEAPAESLNDDDIPW